MTARCAAHSLAIGPDGMCVLCRRESAVNATAAAATDRSVESSSLLPIVVASVFGLAFVGGAVGVGLYLAAASDVQPEVAEGRGVTGGHDYSSNDAEEAAAQRAAAAAAGRQGTDQATGPLAEARRQVEIDVFSASWCGACRAAKSYLDDHGIAYRVRDIDADPSARQRLSELNPRRSIPVITFDGQSPMIGFDPRALERSLDEAARRRLGTL